ncbi:DUF4129 domain-containing protein [Mycobacterium sp.]|uniref:DUF4129 domain-containing protein n=1 Tax=Mycobacterium sp. TaxID=1785 RepID=UPI003A856A98
MGPDCGADGRPPLMVDRPTAHAIAVVALLIVAAAALRGYLPAPAGPGPREAGGGPAGLMILTAALAIATALLAISIIARLRNPVANAPAAGDLPGLLGSGSGRPGWRVVAIVAAILAAWLLAAWLLSRAFGPPDSSRDVPQQDPGVAAAVSDADGVPGQTPQPDQGPDTLGILLTTTPLLVLLFIGGAIVARRRRPAPPATAAGVRPETPPLGVVAETLARAAELGLVEMSDPGREPRQAIIACYTAMERELSDVPGAAPQEFDTPTEVLARAVERNAMRPAGAGHAVALVELFEEARFSPHVMREEHREKAVRALRLILEDIGPHAGTRR